MPATLALGGVCAGVALLLAVRGGMDIATSRPASTLWDVSVEAALTFGWTVVCSGMVWLVPMDLPVGFALALPPATGWLWVRGRMPLLAVQFAQWVSGTRGLRSLCLGALGHTAGALAAVGALIALEQEAGLEGLVPNPTLGDGTTPLKGMCVEALVLFYLIGLVALLPNWLLSRGLPKTLFFGFMFPAMRHAKSMTGPSLQPVLTPAIKLLREGPGACAAALVPYALGPLLGAVAAGLCVRGRQLAYQNQAGLPIRLAAIKAKEKPT